MGCPTPRWEAMAKTCGRERYASEVVEDGMVWAVARRADVPSALLRGLETSRAASASGVLAVLTASDVKGTNLLGILEPDQPILVADRIRYGGDPICLVLGETLEAACRGASLVDVDFVLLPGLFDPVRALEPGAPLLHEGREGNLASSGFVRRGDVEPLLASCDHVVEETFRFAAQEHAYLETEGGVARYDGQILTMEVSTQNPWRDRDELSRALGLPRDRIRVIAPSLGGGFGGKDGVVIQGLLGLAALHSGGRPVKMVFSRKESFLCSPKRHGAVTTLTLGCDNSGRLRALRGRVLFDGGAYESMSLPVLMSALDHLGGCYRFEAVDLEGKVAYTNNPVGGAFRAFGAPQVEGALEQLVDRLASAVALDPLSFRLKNGLVRGDQNASGVTLAGTVGIVPCLRLLGSHPLWKERESWAAAAPPGRLRATGIAAVVHAQGFGPGIPDFANARIDLTEKGLFRIFSAIPDMGQGNGSTYVQLAGDLLCQGPERFELLQPDTGQALRSGPAAASRTTYIYGRALLEAVS
ncbi:MAG: xanthine dehydrogenase family protein, partial [Synergistales bacterium]|nr:xanthine dehydrogenase family protein [Synergistales bacterium]